MIERKIKKLELQNGLVPFDEWFDSLGDKRMQAVVDARMARVRAGNFGDCKSVGGGVFELRITFGPGLRVYYGLYDKQMWCCWAAVTKTPNRVIFCERDNCGDNLQNMRLRNYKDSLNRRLRDPEYAAEYLAQVLAGKDSDAFLIALRDVVEACGGMGTLSGQVGLKRPSLYKILSKNGNPTLETLQEILKPLGLRVSVALDKAA